MPDIALTFPSEVRIDGLWLHKGAIRPLDVNWRSGLMLSVHIKAQYDLDLPIQGHNRWPLCVGYIKVRYDLKMPIEGHGRHLLCIWRSVMTLTSRPKVRIDDLCAHKSPIWPWNAKTRPGQTLSVNVNSPYYLALSIKGQKWWPMCR